LELRPPSVPTAHAVPPGCSLSAAATRRRDVARRATRHHRMPCRSSTNRERARRRRVCLRRRSRSAPSWLARARLRTRMHVSLSFSIHPTSACSLRHRFAYEHSCIGPGFTRAGENSREPVEEHAMCPCPKSGYSQNATCETVATFIMHFSQQLQVQCMI